MTTRASRIRAAARAAPALLLLLAPAAAAAQAVGAQCADCHDAVVKAFAGNPHAGAAHRGAVDCASCHAGAAEHAQTGDPAQVFSFRREEERGAEVCLHCHGSGRSQKFWRGSAHEVADVSCASCHAVHGNRPRLLASAGEGATCFRCHPNVRADLMKRSTHPLRDGTRAGASGQMTCSSCHNPHGAASRALVDARSVNDKCYQCHAELRAPVLWEHSPVKEDCLTCHTPHGSTHETLLVQRVPRLCQECHMQGRHQSGTLAPSSVFAFNRSCLNCHPMVHGSNHPSGPVLQR